MEDTAFIASRQSIFPAAQSVTVKRLSCWKLDCENSDDRIIFQGFVLVVLKVPELASAQLSKILCCSRDDVCKELYLYSACWLPS